MVQLLIELWSVLTRERVFGAVLFWLVALGGAGIAGGVLWCARLVAGLL